MIHTLTSVDWQFAVYRLPFVIRPRIPHDSRSVLSIAWMWMEPPRFKPIELNLFLLAKPYLPSQINTPESTIFRRQGAVMVIMVGPPRFELESATPKAARIDQATPRALGGSQPSTLFKASAGDQRDIRSTDPQRVGNRHGWSRISCKTLSARTAMVEIDQFGPNSYI